MLNYSIEDLIYELNHFLNFDSGIFPTEKHTHVRKITPVPDRVVPSNVIEKEEAWLQAQSLFHSILDLDQIYRFEGDSPYKLHRSYPSPRSLYPLKLFIKPAGSNKRYCRNQFSTDIEEYNCNDKVAYYHEVIITYDPQVYPEIYRNIWKSLLILEIGHLFYNLFSLVKPYASNFTLHIKDECVSIGIIGKKKKIKGFKKSENFDNILVKRTSGTFENGLTPLFRYNDQQHIFDQLMKYLHECIEEASLFYKFDPKDVIGIYVLSNRNGEYFNLYNYFEDAVIDGSIDYKKFNEMYPYIHFRGVNFMVAFSIKHHALHKYDLTLLITLIGFVCQAISLFFTKLNMFSRPLKSFSMEFMEKELNINSSIESLHYLLVAGYSRSNPTE